MSKDIIVLTPNGRRQKVQCTPDTSMLQVLEDVCKKQGFQSSDYDLKYHNHIIDLTTTIRFSNVPNKATLEMVEAERKREEVNVTIGLMLEDGERIMGEFTPNTTLHDMITSLAPEEISMLEQPSILYMRQEVTGISALKQKTLRQLGLIKGKAILRLLNKVGEAKQANVSAVYRKPSSETDPKKEVINCHNENRTLTTTSDPGPSSVTSHKFNPVYLIKQEQLSTKEDLIKNNDPIKEENDKSEAMEIESIPEPEPEPIPLEIKTDSNTNGSMSQENLERRLKIEEEVTFLGTQRAIAFMPPDGGEDELEDLPDDFYDLTIEEVRRLYNDLQQHRLQLENTPLITTTKREELTKQSSEQKLNTYKNVVVRVQFPDHMILQGIFCPSNTIQDVTNFIREHLEDSDKPFHIFTTPLKETLDPKMTLHDAKFVPCVHMHFNWLEENINQMYLKKEIYSKKTSSDAASILASKYRAPSRRKIDDNQDSSRKSSAAIPSTSKNSKVPKWFKN
ncbi:tether containing UBX domain for GLUT4 isoform X2 [Manduca sexta]|uniref:TUG ubiquitin-like domain-containing protein n=3 Tax=Manduca sexta TaxID=7130 RepID=A0A921ZSM5_MANSE|nr:tether containing UBX domain for GLUT4 isoform X2 [Manduca sexta]KAG6462699.1 hypothetical protein O3G_MSEX013425 [Manduca sexta]